MTLQKCCNPFYSLTLSKRRFLSHRNQSIHLLCKSMDWFLYDKDHRHERFNRGCVHFLYPIHIRIRIPTIFKYSQINIQRTLRAFNNR